MEMQSKTVKLAIILAFSGILTACVVAQERGYFAYRANTTNATKANDALNCKVEATNKVPANLQLGQTPTYTTPTYITPMTTNCYGYSCSTSGGQVMGGQTYGGNVYSYDANQDLRAAVAQQCMTNKGYKLIETRLCAANEIPANLSASMSDKIIKPTGDFCLALLNDQLGVPIALTK